jgi:hypothetical protein
MCCSSCKVPVFVRPQRKRHSMRRDDERLNDGIPRDMYGRPLKNLVRKYPSETRTVIVKEK